MASLLLAVVSFVVLPLLLELWAIRLGRHVGMGGFVGALKYLLPAVFLLSSLAAVATGAIEILSSHDASTRATIIAAGISTALNCGAFFFLATTVAALIVLGAISLRVRRPPP